MIDTGGAAAQPADEARGAAAQPADEARGAAAQAADEARGAEATPWSDALIAATLLANDPGLGGIVVRSAAGPVRDRWIGHLRGALPPGTPLRKLPLHAQDERILGGLDLAATLEAGRPIARPGLLAEADGGIIVAAMAERMTAMTAAHLAAALDTGEIVTERDGFALRTAARIAVVALDEGESPDEAAPAPLAERCAFRVDLTEVSVREADSEADTADPGPPVDDDAALQALCATAMAFGIDSARAPVLALRAARAAAQAGGRAGLAEGDLRLAARLVLMPRATMLPASPDQPPEPEPPEPGEAPRDEDDPSPSALTDIIVEASRASLPPELLAALERDGSGRSAAKAGRGSGAKRRAKMTGRPAGVRPGDPGAGARLSIIDTLRAAAPWQRIRQTADAPRSGIAVRRSDFRIRRFVERAQSTTIFVVDASGSAALERLAETKGAVELLLADAYIKRAQVALIAFRGTGAEIVLPPTRSLSRAKRCLAGLAGGGGTPIAAGIVAGQLLAEAVAGKGQTPHIVLMTDGRANVTLAGEGGRAQAGAEALAEAKRLGAARIAAVLVDIGARPRGEAAALAGAMGAVYAALPRLEAEAMRDVVRRSDPSRARDPRR